MLVNCKRYCPSWWGKMTMYAPRLSHIYMVAPLCTYIVKGFVRVASSVFVRIYLTGFYCAAAVELCAIYYIIILKLLNIQKKHIFLNRKVTEHCAYNDWLLFQNVGWQCLCSVTTGAAKDLRRVVSVWVWTKDFWRNVRMEWWFSITFLRLVFGLNFPY